MIKHVKTLRKLVSGTTGSRDLGLLQCALHDPYTSKSILIALSYTEEPTMPKKYGKGYSG
jgi:hypothetical protein